MAASGNASREQKPSAQRTSQSNPQDKRYSRVVQIQPTGSHSKLLLIIQAVLKHKWLEMFFFYVCASLQAASSGLTESCWPSLCRVWLLPDKRGSTSLPGETSAAWLRTKPISSSNSRRGLCAGLRQRAQSWSKVRKRLMFWFYLWLDLDVSCVCPQIRSCFTTGLLWSTCSWRSKSCCWSVSWGRLWVSMK